MSYNAYPPQYHGAQTVDTLASQALKAVYLKMTFGLLVTAVVSWLLSSSMEYMQFIAQHSAVMWVLIIAEFGLVIGISAGITKMSSATASMLFYLFAAVNGAMLAPIFIVYTHTSIAKTFFITAGTFAAMSVYGYTTNKDLTKFGNILFMALIGLIIASVVNIFTKSTQLGWIISIFGVLIFVGLTAWDTQKIKQMAYGMDPSQHGRLATIGALTLYLDFINLFLYLLRFFGNSRD